MFLQGARSLRCPSLVLRSSTRLLSSSSHDSALPPKRITPVMPSSLSDTEVLQSHYPTVVIGGGHAGCEAVLAASRATERNVLLLTLSLSTVGELSCNPSIGGIGKGHLVREVDALGGGIGRVADGAVIQWRTLNRRKGPAVRGPRGQVDRDLYREGMQGLLKSISNIDVLEGEVDDVVIENGEIKGVVVAGMGQFIPCSSVVVTTGTFLGGTLMCGRERYAGGRHLRDSEEVEPPSNNLSKTFQKIGFEMGRLKTGTPARLDGRTINYDVLTPQPSEVNPEGFDHVRQFLQKPLPNEDKMLTCHQTATNARTHELVMKYEHTLPTYDGSDGDGTGPRYCPSIYKKVVRFPDRSGHNSFLEPEGLNTHIVYPNGMSGPYPPEIQQEIFRTMPGLENVEIVRPGYDVEYDYVNPIQLKHTLETKKIKGLYLAGQICGTTGYEEASAQGIVAGANAARRGDLEMDGEESSFEPFIVARDEGYIGVLIDDLVTKGVAEPYRMFTSRSEYRLSLRADNADVRLTRKGWDWGLVDDEMRMLALDSREKEVSRSLDRLGNFNLFVSEWAEFGNGENMGGKYAKNDSKRAGTKKSGLDVLKMPHVTLEDVEGAMEKSGEDGRTERYAADTVEATVKYSSYMDRQEKDMESWRKSQGVLIPLDIIYSRENMPTLKAEELLLLEKLRPKSFAEASNIQGMTPQGLVYLYHYVLKMGKQRVSRRDKSQRGVFTEANA